MRADPGAPLSDLPGGVWTQRAVGVAALAAGVVLLGMLLLALFGMTVSRPPVHKTALVIVGVVGALAALLLPIGWRMTFSRPNRLGSMLSPALWFVIAGLYLLCAGFMVSRDLNASGFVTLFGVLSAFIGRRASRAGRSV